MLGAENRNDSCARILAFELLTPHAAAPLTGRSRPREHWPSPIRSHRHGRGFTSLRDHYPCERILHDTDGIVNSLRNISASLRFRLCSRQWLVASWFVVGLQLLGTSDQELSNS